MVFLTLFLTCGDVRIIRKYLVSQTEHCCCIIRGQRGNMFFYDFAFELQNEKSLRYGIDLK